MSTPSTPSTGPSARVPRRDATENRAALLVAARDVLNVDPEASLETIATRAGLSRRSVYGHFATRDDLLRELVRLGSGRVAGAVAGITHTDPVVRLALIGTRLWHEVEHVRVMALITVRGPLRSYAADALLPVRAAVLAAVGEALAASSIRSDVTASRLARLVEDSALSVLEESTREALPSRDGHRLVMMNMLGTLGYGWREAQDFIDAHAELAYEALV